MCFCVLHDEFALFTMGPGGSIAAFVQPSPRPLMVRFRWLNSSLEIRRAYACVQISGRPLRYWQWLWNVLLHCFWHYCAARRLFLDAHTCASICKDWRSWRVFKWATAIGIRSLMRLDRRLNASAFVVFHRRWDEGISKGRGRGNGGGENKCKRLSIFLHSMMQFCRLLH